MKLSKTSWLTIVIIAILCVAAFFACQWRQAEKELTEQTKEQEGGYSYCGRVIKAPLSQGIRISFTAFRGDITMINPGGNLKVGRWWDVEEKEYRVVLETLGMGYGLLDPGEEGKTPPTVVVHTGLGRDMGDYLIAIVPEPDALPTDTYTLEVLSKVDGESVTLTKDMPFGDLPRHLYVIRSTEEGIIPIIPVSCEF